ncbi:MAG: ATP-binding protein, partial [Halobacteriota archaeon]
PARCAGHVPRHDPESLATQLSWVAQTAARPSDRSRIERLHDGAASLITVTTAAELYEGTVDIAESILSFDRCFIGVIDGDEIVPQAASRKRADEGVEPTHVSEGVAGRTHRTGRSQLTTRMDEDSEAVPSDPSYQSGISVPVGDWGVFQAVSKTPADFDAIDVELAELLLSYVEAIYERLRADQRLRAERDRLSALFENIPDAAVAYEFRDDRPVVTDVNSAFVSAFGYPEAEVLGADLDRFVVPDDVELDAEAGSFNTLLQAGASIRQECRRLTHEGPRDFLLHAVPLERGRSNAAGYAIYTDITERLDRERELEGQNERLAEFTRIVSHDLRNPLSLAGGYLDLARETADPEHFERVDNALERMEVLIENLLSLAHDGQVVGETAPLDAADVAATAWNLADTASATLAVDDSIPVEAAEERLVDLFVNLFRNAVEHGGSDVRVVVRRTDDGFAVEDDGLGIPEADREGVFDPGYTTGSSGIGFGLAIVRRIVEAHDWRVRVTDGDDGGARFEFETT